MTSKTRHMLRCEAGQLRMKGFGLYPFRTFSTKDKNSSALVEQKRAAIIEGQKLRFQALLAFRETGGSTQGAATFMALLMRPTSPSLLRLVAGLMTSSCFVAMMHWLLHPGDPYCILSLGFGAFPYVAVVGTSHSLLWYSLITPAAMASLLVYPRFPAWYAASLEPRPKKVTLVRPSR
eukprot:symbB.v1.2.005167.t1/scaffold298.1/size236510/11